MKPPGAADVQNSPDRKASALDNPLSGTYVRVLIIEVVVIALLFILVRLFS